MSSYRLTQRNKIPSYNNILRLLFSYKNNLIAFLTNNSDYSVRTILLELRRIFYKIYFIFYLDFMIACIRSVTKFGDFSLDYEYIFSYSCCFAPGNSWFSLYLSSTVSMILLSWVLLLVILYNGRIYFFY